MELLPAIDLFDGKAVRLYKGDYSQMTVYNDNPLSVALDFQKAGAKNVHLVDLQGAKNGDTPNLRIVKEIAKNTNLFIEIGGGVRSMEVVKTYLENGAGRVILGTSAVTDQDFLIKALKEYGDKIAVGVDVKDGFVAIKGWVEKSNYTCFDFCRLMQDLGVKTIICTDVSKDGAMQGSNKELYRKLTEQFDLNVIASGGVNGLSDLIALSELGLYGAIIGKAYYTGVIDLKQALETIK